MRSRDHSKPHPVERCKCTGPEARSTVSRPGPACVDTRLYLITRRRHPTKCDDSTQPTTSSHWHEPKKPHRAEQKVGSIGRWVGEVVDEVRPRLGKTTSRSECLSVCRNTCRPQLAWHGTQQDPNLLLMSCRIATLDGWSNLAGASFFMKFHHSVRSCAEQPCSPLQCLINNEPDTRPRCSLIHCDIRHTLSRYLLLYCRAVDVICPSSVTDVFWLNGARYGLGCIGSRILAFKWHENHWPGWPWKVITHYGMPIVRYCG